MGKVTGRPAGRPRKDSVVPSLVKEEVPALWEWDPDRTTCLNMTFKGYTKNDIAKHLSKHRTTISQWQTRPEFTKRLAEKRGEHVEAVRARRVVQTTRFADKTAKLLDQAFDNLENGNEEGILTAASSVRNLGEEFRKWRAEERIDFGDNVSKKQVNVTSYIGGQIDHNHSGKVSFNVSMQQFLNQKIEDGIIDVDSLPSTEDRQKLLTGMVVQALTDPGVMDLLHEEDRVEEE